MSQTDKRAPLIHVLIFFRAKIAVQESDEVEEQVKEGELEAEEVEPDEEVGQHATIKSN